MFLTSSMEYGEEFFHAISELMVCFMICLNLLRDVRRHRAHNRLEGHA